MLAIISSIDWPCWCWCFLAFWFNFCCCITTDFCIIDTDSFGSAGSPAGWTQVAGSWTNSGGSLTTSSDNGLIIFDTPHPDSIASCVVTVDLRGPDAGDELKVIVNYTDSNNYDYVVLTIEDTNGCLALWKRVGGVNTLLSEVRVDAPSETWHSLTVYFGPSAADIGDGESTENVFAAKLGDTKVTWVKTGTGTKVGLGTGSITGTVKFGAFRFLKHYNLSLGDDTCVRSNYTCKYFEDNFNRGNSTTLGCAWTKAAGSSSINTNKLKITTTNSIVVCNCLHPRGTVYSRLFADISGPAGARVRMIIGYIDNNNYTYMEVQIATSGGADFYMNIGHVVGGADSTIAFSDDITSGDVKAGLTWQGSICWFVNGTDDFIVASAGGHYVVFRGPTPPAANSKVGLSTFDVVPSAVTFDNVEVSRAYSAADPNCFRCDLHCSVCFDQDMPAYIVAIIASMANSAFCFECTGVNGTYVLLATAPCFFFSPLDDQYCEGAGGSGIFGVNVVYTMWTGSNWITALDFFPPQGFGVPIGTVWTGTSVDCRDFSTASWNITANWDGSVDTSQCNDSGATLTTSSPA